MYKATKDPKLLKVAFQQVDRIIKWCKTTCGYANIKNVYTVEKEDKVIYIKNNNNNNKNKIISKIIVIIC